MTTYKQQFLHSDWLKTCQLIPNQWNFTDATLTHIRFVFYHNINAALCKWATCTRQTFLSKTFAQSLNIQKQYERNAWEKSNDAYSLSIRVQSTINHISIFTFLCFLRQCQCQRKCFLSECELKKALRDILTRAAWLEPSNFLLVRSEHAHASYPGLPPGVRFSKDPKTSRARKRTRKAPDKSFGCFSKRLKNFEPEKNVILSRNLYGYSLPPEKRY